MRPNSFWESPQSRVLVLLIVLLRDPCIDPCSLFTCRMIRGKEETSTNQVRSRKGFSRESPTMSSLVSSMSIEELRSFCRVPYDISLELSDGQARSTVEHADNTNYFTQEQFAAGVRFPVLSLVKQFLHIT